MQVIFDTLLCFWFIRFYDFGIRVEMTLIRLKIEFTNKKITKIKKHKIMKKLSLIIAAVFIFGVGNVVKAQDDNNSAEHTITIDIDEVALVDIEGEDGTSEKALSDIHY